MSAAVLMLAAICLVVGFGAGAIFTLIASTLPLAKEMDALECFLDEMEAGSRHAHW